jgi:tRNA splicing ligase
LKNKQKIMNYDFPQINNINDVLPHISGKDEFRVMEKDWYTVVNYAVAFGETFQWNENDPVGSAIRRECRGLIFDGETGNLISRPYHKFFNVGEKDETQLHKINLNEPHVVLEKLDGCCDEDTILITQDGEMTIKNICEKKYKGLVLGYNHTTNQNYWTPIIDHSIKDNNDDWYEIELEDGKKIKLTSNHKVWCVNKNCYVEVSNLNEDDEVLFQSFL